jgi:hypothetical protein
LLDEFDELLELELLEEFELELLDEFELELLEEFDELLDEELLDELELLFEFELLDELSEEFELELLDELLDELPDELFELLDEELLDEMPEPRSRPSSSTPRALSRNRAMGSRYWAWASSPTVDVETSAALINVITFFMDCLRFCCDVSNEHRNRKTFAGAVYSYPASRKCDRSLKRQGPDRKTVRAA